MTIIYLVAAGKRLPLLVVSRGDGDRLAMRLTYAAVIHGQFHRFEAEES